MHLGGFIGPNIYLRALRSLQSGIPSEVQFALHHLVKMSYERGDKYRFDGFPGLAEALINKILDTFIKRITNGMLVASPRISLSRSLRGDSTGELIAGLRARSLLGSRRPSMDSILP